VIKPLVEHGQLNLQYVKWTMEPEKKEGGEEDDYVFEGTDCYFKLMAYILVDQSKKTSWKDTV